VKKSSNGVLDDIFVFVSTFEFDNGILSTTAPELVSYSVISTALHAELICENSSQYSLPTDCATEMADSVTPRWVWFLNESVSFSGVPSDKVLSLISMKIGSC